MEFTNTVQNENHYNSKSPLELLLESVDNTKIEKMTDSKSECDFFPEFIDDEGAMSVPNFTKSMINLQNHLSFSDKEKRKEDLKKENDNKIEVEKSKKEKSKRHKQETITQVKEKSSSSGIMEPPLEIFNDKKTLDSENSSETSESDNDIDANSESTSLSEQEKMIEDDEDDDDDDEDDEDDSYNNNQEAQMKMMIFLYYEICNTVANDTLSIMFPDLNSPKEMQDNLDNMYIVDGKKIENLIIPPKILTKKQEKRLKTMLENNKYKECKEYISNFKPEILYYTFKCNMTPDEPTNVDGKLTEEDFEEEKQVYQDQKDILQKLFGKNVFERFDKLVEEDDSDDPYNDRKLPFEMNTSTFVMFVRAIFFKVCSKYREKAFLKRNDDILTGHKEIQMAAKNESKPASKKHWMLQSCAGYDPWDTFFYSKCWNSNTSADEKLCTPSTIKQVESYNGLYYAWNILKDRVLGKKTGKIVHPIGRLFELFPHCYGVEICTTKVPKELDDIGEPPYCVITRTLLYPGESCYLVNIQTCHIDNEDNPKETIESVEDHPFFIKKDRDGDFAMALFKIMIKFMQYATHIHYDIDKWLDDQKNFLPNNASPDMVVETLFQESHITKISEWYSEICQMSFILDTCIPGFTKY